MLAQNLSFKPCNLLLHFLNLRPTLKVLLSQSIDLFNGSKYIGCSVAPKSSAHTPYEAYGYNFSAETTTQRALTNADHVYHVTYLSHAAQMRLG